MSHAALDRLVQELGRPAAARVNGEPMLVEVNADQKTSDNTLKQAGHGAYLVAFRPDSQTARFRRAALGSQEPLSPMSTRARGH